MRRVLSALIIAIVAAAIVFVLWKIALPSATYVNSNTTSASSTEAQSQEKIADVIAHMTLRQKIEDLLILHTPGTNPATLKHYVEKYQPAGLILMEDNIPATRSELSAETSAIQESTTIPYFIATDEEGCTVKRLASDTFACPKELGTKPIASTSAAFAARSQLLESVGINLNFGIIADITGNPNSFIYPRVFGGDPQIAGARVAAAVVASTGKTLSTLKHFPGHGETPENSHLVVPIVDITEAAWALKDKIPFQDGVDAGADVVMFGQLTYSAVDQKPATLSPAWHEALAQMGFEGLSITDDMIMLQESGDPAYADPIKNAVASLNAGSDLLLYVNDHGGGASDIDVSALVDGIVAAVQSGELSESAIDQKLTKVLTYREKAGAF